MTQAPHPPPLTAAQIVRRAQGGDASARDELARSCQREAFLYALHLTGNRDEALDVAQDALLRFFTSLARFDASRPVRPWLLRIVLNQVRDRSRRARVRRTEALDDVFVDAQAPAGLITDPEAFVARRELQRRVWRALVRLGDKHREVIALRDYLDLSYDEIATALQIPRGTVMSRLHRARRQLAELLGSAQGGAP